MTPLTTFQVRSNLLTASPFMVTIISLDSPILFLTAKPEGGSFGAFNNDIGRAGNVIPPKPSISGYFVASLVC